MLDSVRLIRVSEGNETYSADPFPLDLILSAAALKLYPPNGCPGRLVRLEEYLNREAGTDPGTSVLSQGWG